MNQRHKHADLIHAWADGADIEYFSLPDDEWKPFNTILFSARDDHEYRIKPDARIVKYRVYLTTEGFPCITNIGTPPNFTRWLGDWQEVEVECDQWPSELVARIAKVNLEAANWLKDNWEDLSKYRCTDLSNAEISDLPALMEWDVTPQGHDYWSNISKQLK